MSPIGSYDESSDDASLNEPVTVRGSLIADPAASDGRPVWLQEGKKYGGHNASRLLIQKVL